MANNLLGSDVLKTFEITRSIQNNLSGDKLFTISIFGSIFAILLQSSIILFAWSKLPPLIPLFYSLPWGERLLASREFIWLVPILFSFFVVFNFAVVFKWLKDDVFLRRVIFIANLVLAFMCLFSVSKTIGLLI